MKKRPLPNELQNQALALVLGHLTPMPSAGLLNKEADELTLFITRKYDMKIETIVLT